MAVNLMPTPPAGAVQLPAKPLAVFRWVFTAGALILVLWSAVRIDVKWSRLLEAPADLWNLSRLMFTRMERGDIGKLTAAMWESISIAWLGTIIAAIFAIPLSFLAAENLVGRPVAWVTRQIFNVLRAVPEIILALLFIPVFGFSTGAPRADALSSGGKARTALDQLTNSGIGAGVLSPYDIAVIDGDPETVAEVKDVWTFARDTRSRDPNWRLVATEAED